MFLPAIEEALRKEKEKKQVDNRPRVYVPEYDELTEEENKKNDEKPVENAITIQIY